MNLTPDDRIAGVLVPLFALRTGDDLGVGDLEGLRQFVLWARRLGFRLVQLLPINETGGDHSPYNAISARAIEPTTLHLAPGSPEHLSEKAFAEVAGDVDPTRLRHGGVQYHLVKPLKKKLLERAFAEFERRAPNDEFESFCQAERDWLDDYTLFRVLMEVHGERESWDQWPQNSLAAAYAWLESLGKSDRVFIERRRQFFRYVQWIAHEQWRSIKKFAEKHNVALMGDIPFGISYYSADVFAHPEQFALEWSGGAPPERYFKDDEFTQKWGQNWGIPLYNWKEMRAENFNWWRQRIVGVKEIFHLFRIDHVLGFYRIYAFPWRPERNKEFLPLNREEMLSRTGGRAPRFFPRDDRTWENCAANQCEGEEYLRIVLEESGATRVVGEDLGTVPDYVRPSLRSLGIAGFKIPQWENYPGRGTIPGRAYERLSVATFATHDHQPIRALWEAAFGKSEQAAQAREDLARLGEFAGFMPNDSMNYLADFYPRIFDALFRCESWIAIVMITDLLGRRERFNVPGTAANSNWTRRLHTTVAKLAQGRKLKRQMDLLRQLLEKSGRNGEVISFLKNPCSSAPSVVKESS